MTLQSLLFINSPPEAIAPGDPRGVPWTFTADRWEPDSYLWLAKGSSRVMFSNMHARVQGKGYLRDLIAGVERAGLRVAVPTPFAHMRLILKHYGFVPHGEMSEGGLRAEVWERG